MTVLINIFSPKILTDYSSIIITDSYYYASRTSVSRPRLGLANERTKSWVPPPQWQQLRSFMVGIAKYFIKESVITWVYSVRAKRRLTLIPELT